MKCRVGDKVRFLNDVGGGRVTRIIDKQTVTVLGDDGFEIPVAENEILIIDHEDDAKVVKRIPEEVAKSGTIEDSTSNKDSDVYISDNQNIKNIIIYKKSLDERVDYSKIDLDIPDPEGELLGIFLAFVPNNQQSVIESDQDLYIINDSPYRAFYTISLWEDGLVKPLRAGFIHADTKEFIKCIKRIELNINLTLNIQVLFYKNTSYVPLQPEFCDLSINPTKFYRFGSFAENDFFEEKALIISVTDTKKDEMLKTLTNKAIEESIAQKDTEIRPEPMNGEPELVEVDLHIQEIVDDYRSMKPGEIVETQMARFTTSLETAIRSKTTKKVVFIHGLGNGKLKNEVIRKLNKEYPKLRYQDASFKEYGFGATLVFLK